MRRIVEFDNFVGELHRRDPEHILVGAYIAPARGMWRVARTATVGVLGDYSHGLVYDVQIPRRALRYSEELFTAFQSEYGFADAPKRNQRVASLLLAAEVRVEFLRGELPDADIQVSGPQGQPLSPEVLQRLHEDAESYGITSPI